MRHLFENDNKDDAATMGKDRLMAAEETGRLVGIILKSQVKIERCATLSNALKPKNDCCA